MWFRPQLLHPTIPIMWITTFCFNSPITESRHIINPQLKLMTSSWNSQILSIPCAEWSYVLAWNYCVTPHECRSHLKPIFRLIIEQQQQKKHVSSWVCIFLNELNKTAWEESFHQNHSEVTEPGLSANCQVGQDSRLSASTLSSSSRDTPTLAGGLMPRSKTGLFEEKIHVGS